MAVADEIADRLVELVPSDVGRDLAGEDAAAAVEVHFPPVVTRALPAVPSFGDPCSVDGYYDPYIDPDRPHILYSESAAEARIRFTILHELGHHLFAHNGAHLLDDLDRAAGPNGSPHVIEEAACQSFAGRLLVPEELIDEVIGDSTVVPAHVLELHERSTASWEAVAVRAAERIVGSGAVLLVHADGTIRFCASSGGRAASGWKRGSSTNPNGPLHHAATESRTARPDDYRWTLPFADRMFCDTLPVHDGLGIGVMAPRASDRHVELIDAPTPSWQRLQFCEWDNEERTVGWCEQCKGRHCRECGRCGCHRPPKNPVCSDCGLNKPHRRGASVCVDCEE